MKGWMKKNTWWVILFCFFISFIVLLIGSKCSPLYLFNDWVDVNAFFTTGKGLMNGKVPYLDLFEQKGPTLYLLYGIGYLFSHTTFHGIFFLEILNFTIFLYFFGKISDLFLKKELKYFLLPILATLLVTAVSFSEGGSAEEFCFSFFAISLYYYLRFLQQQLISYNILFWNGLIAGLVLTVKFTLLGFWFGFMASIFFLLLLKKQGKRAICSCFVFLAGMLLPLLLWVIYFSIHHGLAAFFDVYFVLNLTTYGKEFSSFVAQFKNCFMVFLREISNQGVINAFLFGMIFLFIFRNIKNVLERLALFITIFCSILFVYIGGTYFSYYLLILLPWLGLSLIGILKWVKVEKLNRKSIIIGSIISMVICFGCCYGGANHREDMFLHKEDDYHFIFADIIKKDKKENQTLLNYGALDFGLYTTANIIPTVRYFHLLNIPYDKYPYLVDAHNQYVTDQVVCYFLFATFTTEKVPESFLENYQIVASKRQDHAGYDFTFYLLRKKEESEKSDTEVS